MTLLKYVQVVVSDWISIAVFDRDRSSPPRWGPPPRTDLSGNLSEGPEALAEGAAAPSFLPRLLEGPRPPSQSGRSEAPKFCSEGQGSRLVPRWTSRPSCH